MNKYLGILLGFALVLIPIYLLFKFNVFLIFLKFVGIGIALISILVGILLFYSGLSELRDSVEEKYLKEEQEETEIEDENEILPHPKG